MVLDANLKLYDGALDRAPNTNVFPDANKNGFSTDGGNALELGRRGLPFGSQFIGIIDNPGGTAANSPGVVVILQLSLDNGTTYRDIATIDFGDPTDDFQGIRVTEIGQDFSAQEYADANIQLRAQVVPTGTAANNVNADKLALFVGAGESQKWGRKKSANTLFV